MKKCKEKNKNKNINKQIPLLKIIPSKDKENQIIIKVNTLKNSKNQMNKIMMIDDVNTANLYKRFVRRFQDSLFALNIFISQKKSQQLDIHQVEWSPIS